MRQYVLAITLFGMAVLITNALSADEPKKEESKLAKKDIGKMMADIHRGEKSSYSRVNAELKKDSPDWDVIAKETKSFAEMSAAFKKAPLGYTSPAKYISSAESLAKAASEKDKKAADTAFVGLTNSCNSCHYGGAKAMLK
jgi:cytochrome c556